MPTAFNVGTGTNGSTKKLREVSPEGLGKHDNVGRDLRSKRYSEAKSGPYSRGDLFGPAVKAALLYLPAKLHMGKKAYADHANEATRMTNELAGKVHVRSIRNGVTGLNPFTFESSYVIKTRGTEMRRVRAAKTGAMVAAAAGVALWATTDVLPDIQVSFGGDSTRPVASSGANAIEQSAGVSIVEPQADTPDEQSAANFEMLGGEIVCDGGTVTIEIDDSARIGKKYSPFKAAEAATGESWTQFESADVEQALNDLAPLQENGKPVPDSFRRAGAQVVFPASCAGGPFEG